ncbi:MAK10-like protein [Tanacetum coccineum]
MSSLNPYSNRWPRIHRSPLGLDNRNKKWINRGKLGGRVRRLDDTKNSQINVKEMDEFNEFINVTWFVEIPMGRRKFTRVSDDGIKFSGGECLEQNGARADCRFRDKLKNVKIDMKAWSKNKFEAHDEKIEEYKQEALKWELEAENRHLSDVEIERNNKNYIRGLIVDGVWSEAPNVIKLEVFNYYRNIFTDRPRTRPKFVSDQASNWLKHLPAGSITTWEDLTTRFLAQFFLPGRTAKLRNDILMFQQHHGDLSQKHGLVSRTYYKKSLIMTSTFGSKSKFFMTMSDEPLTNRPVLKTRQKQISIYPRRSTCKNGRPGLFTLPCRLGDSKPFDTLADLGSCVNLIPIYLFKNLNIVLLEETGHIFGLADGTKSYPVRIVKDVEVHIGKLKLLNDFYVIDMKKDPETPLLVGRGFLATANTVIDCKMAKIALGEGITRSVFGVKGVGLGAIPINLKSNMWESEDLIKNPINWDKPPKDGDGALHAKIKLINPDGEEFNKTQQSIHTSRKLSERESPKEIIDLDHFYDT